MLVLTILLGYVSGTTSHLLQLIGDWVHSFQEAAAIVLTHGRRVMVYSGKDDFICNYLGGKAWVESTQWSGHVSMCSRQMC